MLNDFWNGLGRGARTAVLAGAVGVAGAALVTATWLLQPDYRVLFADLAAPDAAVMVAELERMKVPYRLGEDGTTILVDAAAVHKTRLKLMSHEMPLHGTVGFELFNNSDFGMTEFAQKINYQRALQGEITRTILSLSEIEAARVHLALPEDGLFKRTDTRAKASITLTVRRGQSLRPEQISGIQRLVSASVPAIQTQDVTILDQHGVALTRPAASDGGSVVETERLDVKKETEDYLAKKAAAVLDRTFGSDKASVSVDATLNMDQVKVTSEDVIAAPPSGGHAGVVVRERESSHDGNEDGHDGRHGDSTKEVEYQVGRRVQQLVSAPGAIVGLHVVAMIRTSLDAEQTEQVREMVSAAVGASRERGDVVVVQPLDDIAPPPLRPMPEAPVPVEPATVAAPAQRPAPQTVMILGACLCLVLGVGVGALLRRRRGPMPLSESERQAALLQVRSWLAEPETLDEGIGSASWKL